MPFENAVDAADLIARQGLAQRFDDRDAAGHRGLEVEGHAVLPASRASSVPCLANSALLAVTTCFPAFRAASTAPRASTLLTANQFDEHVDCRIGCQPFGRVEPGYALELDAALLLARAGADPGDLDPRPSASARRAPCSLKSCTNPAPTGAKAGDAKLQRLAHANQY